MNVQLVLTFIVLHQAWIFRVADAVAVFGRPAPRHSFHVSSVHRLALDSFRCVQAATLTLRCPAFDLMLEAFVATDVQTHVVRKRTCKGEKVAAVRARIGVGSHRCAREYHTIDDTIPYSGEGCVSHAFESSRRTG